ncbi:MAG: TIGR03960 family B12-binding radical SAM protein [Thermodesulfobacteriota bacterium]|nr:TIGR03960 family B12-binding radical SAM protein [Thermodesulfobacteriota bacterium]
MSILDQSWFSRINRPSRYLGNEVNSIRKDRAEVEVSVALAFPDVYDVGMSHLGLKILYHLLNAYPWISAERVFCPWIDLEKELRNREILLGTLESDLPLSSFDIVGFSLQTELCYTNVLTMLALSSISFLSAERGERDPIIIAGGPACFNPEPVADLFDVFVIGDGEEAALEICHAIRVAKQEGIRGREELISRLGHVKGVYIPSNFRVHYSHNGIPSSIEPLLPDCQVVEKAIVPDIGKYACPDHQVVPFTELVHDRVVIELARGCTRGCRFCQAGMIYRPVRERSPGSVLETAEKALRFTGYDEVSLLSLSSGDYCCIQPLLEALMEAHSDEKVAVSLPSLRVDSLTTSLMEQIKRVRKTGFTLAPEAGNDRLRKIINKGLTQKEILETARAVYEAGWNLIKLYFMIGLPYEEERDLEDIVSLGKQVAGLAKKRGKRPKVNLSISTFVPKSHTPFMWVPQISLQESRRRIRFIREGLKNTAVKVKWNEPELSWLDGIFSRGDRRLGNVIIEAWRMGSRFDAWGDHFRMENWQEAFRRTGLDPDFYLLRERSLDEVLPWDHIKTGVTKTFLKNEWERSGEQKTTPDCREKCLECGVCDHKHVDPVIFKGWNPPHNLTRSRKETKIVSSRKYRLTFTKLGHAKYLGHLELVQVFLRAFKRSGLHLVYSRGFHPMPRVSFTCALPLGTESMQETVETEIMDSLDSSSLKEIINGELPRGIDITMVEEIRPPKKKARLKQSHFLVTLDGVEFQREKLEEFLRSDCFPVVKVDKKGKRQIDARLLIESMDLISPNRIKLVLKHIDGPGLKPAQIVAAVFSLKDSDIDEMRTLKTLQILS